MARLPRLKSLSIQDFRGFPGRGNAAIEFGGKNLLVYGENGSGKSTIFHALDGFFSIAERSKGQRAKLLADSAHIFTPEADRLPSVEVVFNDGMTVGWDANGHPNDPTRNSRVYAASYRKGMLDYRSLLDLSYAYLGKRINLFEACVKVLLRDLQIPYSGSERPFHRLWNETLDQFKRYHFQAVIDGINARLNSINAGLDLALPNIINQTNAILADMLKGEIELSDLEFTHLAFRWVKHRPNRSISGQSIIPEFKLRGATIPSPHTLLNEARVSALAIALYLAGRKICGETVQPDTPKLLVLDDLLIGLDQSNRLPVLSALTKHFSDWQIVLLTHDRVWFEMARAHLPANGRKAWTALEMYEANSPEGGARPVQRPVENFDSVAGNLARARAFLADNYDNAAAVHARMAFEQSLKRFCERKSIPVIFKSDHRFLTTDHLLTGIEEWLGKPKFATEKVQLAPAIGLVKAARRVILNPFSHSTPVTLVSAEVTGGIDAVENLDGEFRRAFPR